MRDSVETFQLTVEAAEIYEAQFVPALFGEWATHLVDAARVEPGHRVLDVACGTGVVARQVDDRLGTDGSVVGVDLNEAMLTVARRLRPHIEWRQADAAELPFPERSFDIVLCQAALMFFPDPVQALHEMARVARSAGTVAVQVWSGLASQPAYRPFYDIVARHAGPDAVDLISTYFSLGDLGEVTARFKAAGLDVTATRTRMSAVRLPSIDDAVAIEVKGTPLGDRISDDVYARILEDSRTTFAHYLTEAGTLDLPIEGALITARPS